MRNSTKSSLRIRSIENRGCIAVSVGLDASEFGQGAIAYRDIAIAIDSAPSAVEIPWRIHCQIWAREISAVAASSIRL